MSDQDASRTADHGGPTRIHVDQQQYESSNPTTGAALYRLGHVKPGFRLYREVTGNLEDPAIEDGPDTVVVTQDEHFHSAELRGVTIIVEGTPHLWTKPRIRYIDVVTLFDPSHVQHPEITYSVTYDHGPAHNPEGILSPGGTPVRVKDRMEFSVSPTNQS